jgi:hypothetical protein
MIAASGGAVLPHRVNDSRLDVAGDLLVRFVVHAGDLLLAFRHDAHLRCRHAIGIGGDAAASRPLRGSRA